MRRTKMLLVLVACSSVFTTQLSGQGVGINIPIVGRLIGGGNTLFLTALDVSNHTGRDLTVDFYVDGEDLTTRMPIAVKGSIGPDGLPANRGAGGSFRQRSNAHFDDFVESLVVANLLPTSIRTNGFLGSALFVFNGTSRRGEGGVTARFYNSSGGGTIGVSFRGREITTNEPQSLVATVRDTRANTTGAPRIYPNLFINNNGLRPDATGAAGTVSIEISAISSSSGQPIGVPIVINGLGPGRTTSISQVLNALQILPQNETTVLVFARVVAGDASIQGLISQVDNVTRDSSLFEMSRADF